MNRIQRTKGHTVHFDVDHVDQHVIEVMDR
jgi:hypothetical protein